MVKMWSSVVSCDVADAFLLVDPWGGQDLNLRPTDYESGASPPCHTAIRPGLRLQFREGLPSAPECNAAPPRFAASLLPQVTSGTNPRSSDSLEERVVGSLICFSIEFAG